jgi:hypothetical protein
MPANTAEKSLQVFVNETQYIEVDSLYNKTEQQAKSVGYFEIGLGLAGSVITEIKIDGVNILPNPVNYVDQVSTAAAIAAGINTQTNDFGIIATSNSKMVILQGSDFGTLLNEKIISATVTGTINILNISNFSGGSEGYGSNVFLFSASENGTMKLTFGDGKNGSIPSSGSTITINYKSSNGDLGNVPSNKINIIDDDITLPDGVILYVKNEYRFQGGKDLESISSIKKSIPAKISSRGRAVTEPDFTDVVSLIPGVLSNKVDYNKDKNLRIYVYPYGGGIAGDYFLNYVYSYLESNKITVGYDLDILPSGEIKTLIKITAYAKSGYNRDSLKTSIQNAITNIFGWREALINQNRYVSDLYEQIEAITGISGTNIDKITCIPYPEPIDQNETQLNWTISLISTPVVTNKWLIVFSTQSSFALYKNNVYKGTFNVNEENTIDEITFTIKENYIQNNRWQFFTYPDFTKNGGVISLMENSAVVSYAEDIDITIIGGV